MGLAALACASSLALAAAPALAQEPAPVYQQEKPKPLRFAGDLLARYEWSRDIPEGGGEVSNDNRWRLQFRPRLEVHTGPFEAGVGGEFNYSSDQNYLAPPGEKLFIVWDNYRSRDARVDLAYGRLTVGPVVAEGGRFLMPLPLTEMIWDRDLRPQGGAVGIDLVPRQSSTRLTLRGIYAKGSHVFEDESVMYGGGLELRLGTGAFSSFDLAGSYLQFQDLDQLDPTIRRQNTRVAGLIVNDYRVVDAVLRFTRLGTLPLQLVADYCWNTAISEHNQGVWLAAALGSLTGSRARLEYTYASIDKDATVAAFNSDDFWWNTGWQGHRGDLGIRTVRDSSLHAIAQWQRYKDSPDPSVHDTWMQRYRIEWRTRF